MTRLLAALALVLLMALPPMPEARPHRRSVCVPVFLEGAGIVWIWAPARAR